MRIPCGSSLFQLVAKGFHPHFMTLPENWDVYKKSRNLAKHLWSNGSQMLIRAPTPALRKKQVAACTSCLAIHCFVIMFHCIKLP